MATADGAPGARPSDAGWLIVLMGSILAPLALVAPRTPTALIIFCALAGAALLGRRGVWPAHPPRALAWLLAAAACWSAISAWWSLNPGLALTGTAKLGASLAGGLLLIGVARRAQLGSGWWLRAGVTAGVAAAMAFLAIEALFGAPISKLLWNPFQGIGAYDWQVGTYGAFWLDPGTAVTALTIWLLILCWPRMPAPVVVGVGSAAVIALAAIASRLGFEAGAVALTAGGIAALAAGRWGQRIGGVLAVLAAIVVLAAPLAPRTVLKPEAISRMAEVSTSALPRVYIWSFAAERIAEKPFLGWGMNAARIMPGGQERIHDSLRNRTMGEVMPLHPHNAALQVWMELGLPGALLLAGLFAWVVRHATSLGGGAGGRAAAAATGLCTTAAVLLSLSFGVWQSWWLATIFIACALFTAIGELNRR